MSHRHAKNHLTPEENETIKLICKEITAVTDNKEFEDGCCRNVKKISATYATLPVEDCNCANNHSMPEGNTEDVATVASGTHGELNISSPLCGAVHNIKEIQSINLNDFHPIDCNELLLQLDDITTWLNNYSIKNIFPNSLFSTNGKIIIIAEEDFKKMSNFGIVGDIHGDELALACIYEYLPQTQELSDIDGFFFLGDIFDRSPRDGGFAALLYHLSKMIIVPQTVVWILGNHDAGLKFDSEQDKFFSDTEPGEFALYLNNHPELKAFGIALLKFLSQLPCAVVLPTGILLSHGGIPHQDMTDEIIKEFNDLENPDCLDDFMWARVTDTKCKYPNRFSKGHDIGYENFSSFCERTSHILNEKGINITVQTLICGHQHEFTEKSGFLLFSNYKEKKAICIYSSFYMPPVVRWGSDYIYANPCIVYGINKRESVELQLYTLTPIQGSALDDELTNKYSVKSTLKNDAGINSSEEEIELHRDEL